MTIRWPRLLTPTQLSQIIQNQKNPLRALEIFNEAKYRYPKYHHNGSVYAALINILGSSGRLTEMKHVINQMKEDSCQCHDSIIVSAIKSYAKAKLIDEAVLLFKSLPSFNCVNWTQSFNALLEILIEESKLDLAYHLFLENSSCWEVKSRTFSLNLLMGALCRMKRSDLACHIFQEMNYQSCYPDKGSYRILMSGLCQEKRFNEAIHLLYSMFWRVSQKGSGEDVVIYRTLLEELCDNGDVDEAVKILSKVLHKGLKAPKRHRKHIDLTQCHDGADIDSLKVLINDALIKGLIPSSESYRAMAIDYYNGGKIDEGNKVLSEMCNKGFRPSVEIYEAKVAALFREHRVNEAVEVVDHNNCAPSIFLYNALIKGLCDERKSDLALKYLEKISRQVGCVANRETYENLVDGLCHEGRYAKASLVMEQMLNNSYWPRVQTFNALIPGLCLVDDLHKAIMLLEEMISQAKIPEPSVWLSLVASICHDTAENHVLYRLMEKLIRP
nr:pentatricopeptide repeat-containing protein At1g05600 [Ipomoea batatas]